MWACGGRPSLIPPRPVDIITCTKPNRCFFVSAKFQKRRSRRQNTNYNYNLYDDEDDDDVQVTTETEESSGNSCFKSEDSGVQQQVPSGSDILRALQRATVRKHNNKKKKQQQQQQQQLRPKLDIISTSTSIGDGDTPIKPLRIKSDWRTRLDDLQQRLQELLHT